MAAASSPFHLMAPLKPFSRAEGEVRFFSRSLDSVCFGGGLKFGRGGGGGVLEVRASSAEKQGSEVPVSFSDLPPSTTSNA